MVVLRSGLTGVLEVHQVSDLTGEQDPLCFISGGPGKHRGVGCGRTSKLLLGSRLAGTLVEVTSLDWAMGETSLSSLKVGWSNNLGQVWSIMSSSGTEGSLAYFSSKLSSTSMVEVMKEAVSSNWRKKASSAKAETTLAAPAGIATSATTDVTG